MEITRKQVMVMEAGREMDRLVGGLIMGLDLVEDTLPQLPKHYYPGYDRTVFTDVPKYSTDISAAWEVVENMRTLHKRYITIFDNPHLNYDVRFDGTIEYERLSNLPHAICRAALTAIITE